MTCRRLRKAETGRPLSQKGRRKALIWILPGACLLSSWLCGAAPEAPEAALTTQDLEIVECLLPGQVRQLGNSTYLTQRRPTRTTASDCRIRGGEYVAYDRADVKTSLRIWMAAAEGGDVEAQTNVGEIYERGLGDQPNYEAAVIWYQKAADKGYARALFNLGTMYEQGHGVPQDKLKALNLYRQAWGMPVDDVVYASAAKREQDEQRDALDKELQEKDQQLNLLQQQVDSLQKQIQSRPTVSPEVQSQIDSLKALIARLEAERKASTQQLASLPKAAAEATAGQAVAASANADVARLRAPAAAEIPAAGANIPQADPRIFEGLDFGRYYALVIGNQHYQFLESLSTPISDAERVARVLRTKYGFTVKVLEDTDGVGMLKALNDLNEVLKPEDNLLIYYGGHGYRLQSDQFVTGYWLPVNSERPPKDTFWIANAQITAHLARLPAKRILVVADSCYSGLLSTDPSYLFLDSKIGYTRDYIAYKLPKRSRLLLSSGGDEPVLDGGGGGDSVFARAFVEELENNMSVLPSQQLFSDISQRVQIVAAQNHFAQKPVFKSIKEAGHEVGDFFFVPRDAGAQKTP